MRKRIALLLVSCAALWAQDFRATITGQVTDPSKAVIPDASVKAINAESNVITEVKTNAQGFYTLPYLNPGSYNIEVIADGFRALRRTGIILQVADKLSLPVTLELGGVASEITVVGEQEILQTETASRGLVFDPIKTAELPLNGRQSYMLMALTPGVIFTQEEFGASGFSGTRGWDVNGSYKINGGRGGNQFLLNGAPISVNGSWQVSPNVEAIQEFKVMTNTYDAQYGRTWGGTVNTTLKSGTNSWHGSGFDFMRNSILDANTTQNNLNGKPRGKHIVNQFGGVIGGPIRKDKDFIFFSDESWRERVPFPSQGTTVPMDMRDGTGFSNWGVSIYDPMTSRPCQSGVSTADCHGSTYIRDPFPGGIIPASRISPIGKKILDLYPAPNFIQNGLNSNYIASGNTGKYRYDQPMGRWDKVLGEKDRFYALVAYQHGWEYRSRYGWDGAANMGDIYSQRTYQQYMADWTHVVSANMVLDVRASFVRFTSLFPNGDLANTLTPEDLGMNMLTNPTAYKRTAPRIEMDGLSDVIPNNASWSTQNHFDFAPSVSHTINRHSLHYGFEYARFDFGDANPSNANGYFHFDRGWTQQLNGWGAGQSDGSPVASLLLGYPAWGGVDYNATYYRRNPYYAAYIQDDWKILPKLTLNLGLRYDVQVPFTEMHNRVNAGFDFNAVSPISDRVIANWKRLKAEYDATSPKYPYPDVPTAIYGGKLFAGVNGQPRRTYDTDWSNLQPRFGFAWNALPRTVLRGGFGIYHKTVDQGNLTDGFSQYTSYNSSLDSGRAPSGGNSLTGPYSLANPYPTGIGVPQGAALGLLTNVGNGVGVDGRQRVLPRTFEYSFTIEHQLPWNMVIDASYVGNITRKDTLCCDGINMNYVTLSQFNQAHTDASYLERALPNPFQGIAPATTGMGSNSTIQAQQLMRPFPQFGDLNYYTNPWAHYRYDAFQAKLEKRVMDSRTAGAMTFVVSYTFSKAYEANHWYNRWNYANEKIMNEIEYQDKPQSFAFSGVWDLPLGQGKRFGNFSNPVAKKLAGGWTFDWIFTYYSGYPTGKPGANFTCANWQSPNQSYDQWFNNDRSCWQPNSSYTLRTYDDRFSNVRNPSAPQLNIALAKMVDLSERFKLNLRGEAFNFTNTPIPYGPNTDWWSDRLGKIGQAQQNFPRLVQVAAKFIF